MNSTKVLTVPAIRLKVTGSCNRSCNFCHEEGDMVNIHAMDVGSELTACMRGLTQAIGASKVMLTGGEPTLHPHLHRLIGSVEVPEVSMTTNGVRLKTVEAWSALKTVGLSGVTVSIHDVDPVMFLGLEVRRRTLSWAQQAIDNQFANLANLHRAGIYTRVNTVAYGDLDATRLVLRRLRDVQRELGFEIRLLNDLNHPAESKRVIDALCSELGAEETWQYQRSGSSNVTRYFQAPDGFTFSAKMSYPYFFEKVCAGCPIRESGRCAEGFYGVRVEARGQGFKELYVRLCIYSQGRDVLMPWRDFISQGLAREHRSMYPVQ